MDKLEECEFALGYIVSLHIDDVLAERSPFTQGVALAVSVAHWLDRHNDAIALGNAEARDELIAGFVCAVQKHLDLVNAVRLQQPVA